MDSADFASFLVALRQRDRDAGEQLPARGTHRQETIGGVKCGHTGVRVNPDLAKGKGMLPLMVRVLDAKVYVLRDLSSTPSALAGQEIRAINGMTIAKIVQSIIVAVPGDGDVQTSRQRRIGGPDFAVNLIDLLCLEGPYRSRFGAPNKIASILFGWRESKRQNSGTSAQKRPPSLPP
jgi:hypothetical protein